MDFANSLQSDLGIQGLMNMVQHGEDGMGQLDLQDAFNEELNLTKQYSMIRKATMMIWRQIWYFWVVKWFHYTNLL